VNCCTIQNFVGEFYGKGKVVDYRAMVVNCRGKGTIVEYTFMLSYCCGKGTVTKKHVYGGEL
jgi:hypothetical protein